MNKNLAIIIFPVFAVLVVVGAFAATLRAQSEAPQVRYGASASTLRTVSSQESPELQAVATPQAETELSFTLETSVAAGQLVFIGVGGDIDGLVNPDLRVPENATVRVTLVNGDGMEHDISLPDFGATSEKIHERGSRTEIVFEVGDAGIYEYLCAVPGHKAAGMVGRLIVGEASAESVNAVSVSRDPSDLPGPIGPREVTTIDLELETTEVEGHLADGTSYTYWTFNDAVPGPFVRVKVGDTINVTLRNHESSRFVHSVDFHAVTGPGGGATVTQTAPGEETRFSFKALNPGLYVYHCATHSHAHHISSGMYGLILVEPEEGLAEVDHEFYVMQGELYTVERFGTQGHLEFSHDKLLDERAEYVIFNGAVDALTAQYPMQAQVGDTVRIFFGVGGPNYISSLHLIGEIFDRVYPEAATNLVLENVQTTLVPAGGATVVEVTLDVPGRYILVDHALSRLERGLAGFLEVSGDEDHSIYNGTQTGRGH